MSRTEYQREWSKLNPEYIKGWRKRNQSKIAKYNKEWREQNPGKVQQYSETQRWSRILKKYGLTREEWETMFKAQGEACAACYDPKPGSKRGWHVDHDHDTNKVREILCHRCNTALGAVKECVKRLHNLITYLEKHNASS